MEHKHAKAYSNFLKLLPKASVNFQNPLHSPTREKRSDHHHHLHKTHKGKGFSGPVMSMSLVPIEARRNLKNNDQSLANQEPTSPKISCMGQIKHKHKKKIDKAKSFSVAKEDNNNSEVFSRSPKEAKKRASMLKRMFTMSKPARKSFDQADHHVRCPLPDRAPGLSQMKRFASGRETFASFDWTAHQVAPETDRGTYYSYEERGDTDQEQEQDEDEFIIPFSAPIAVVKGVALQPRKEVNLWKRRTMNPPAPLQLNSMVDIRCRFFHLEVFDHPLVHTASSFTGPIVVFVVADLPMIRPLLSCIRDHQNQVLLFGSLVRCLNSSSSSVTFLGYIMIT